MDIVDIVVGASCAGDAEYAARLNATIGYVHTQGLLVADDVLERAAAQRKTHAFPLEGAYVLRIVQPIKCSLISFGRVGCLVPITAAVSATGDYSTCARREDTTMMGRLMQALDPGLDLGLRVQWYFADLAKTGARFVRAPGQSELSRAVKRAVAHPERMKREGVTDVWADLEKQEQRSQATAKPKTMLDAAMRSFKRAKQTRQRMLDEVKPTRRAVGRAAARMAQAYAAKYGRGDGNNPAQSLIGPTDDDGAAAEPPPAKRARVRGRAGGTSGPCGEAPVVLPAAVRGTEMPRLGSQDPALVCGGETRPPRVSGPECSELSAESPRTPQSPCSPAYSDTGDLTDENEDDDLFGE